MLEFGADVNACTEDQTTSLHFACKKGNLTVVKRLIKARAVTDAIDVSGSTPLLYAIEKGFTKIILKLIQAGADIKHQSYDGTFISFTFYILHFFTF